VQQAVPGPEIPDGFVRVQVQGVMPTPDGPAVLLTNPSHTKVVPIFISEGQAMVIELRMQRQAYARPLTHDLFDALLRQAGGRISSVRIDAIQENVFVATVTVHLQNRRFPLDARASDAIALALGNDAPIYMSSAVLERAGVQRDTVVPPEQEPTEGGGDKEPGEI
jgi:bifunctional DNase/RNase